ncbi:MAG TPA: hypothetical protein VF856_01775 [Gemmatimonadaceae bacterium]
MPVMVNRQANCNYTAARCNAIRYPLQAVGTHQGGATGEAGDADDFSGAAGLRATIPCQSRPLLFPPLGDSRVVS